MGDDLADTQLMNKYNKEFFFLLCVINIYSKHDWVVPLKYEESITITNAFQKVLNQSGHKPNKIWVYKRSKIYNRLMQSWLQYNDIGIYSKHNQKKIFCC